MDVTAIPRLVGTPENVLAGQRISDASITLVRDNGKLLPLRNGRPGRACVFPIKGPSFELPRL